MISLLSTILKLSYESNIRFKRAPWLIEIALIIAVAALSILVVYGLCAALIAVLDLAAAITIIIPMLKSSR